MLRATRFSGMPASSGPVFVAAGFFDGVHRGHQRVIARTLAAARAAGGAAWALTFDTHPLRVLAPDRAPPLLTSARHKVALLDGLGLDGCLVLPFDGALANLAPAAFLEMLRRGIPDWRAIFVGPNWRFGRRAAGNLAGLKRWAFRHGISVAAVTPARRGNAPVSSTRIREAVAAGRLAEAAGLLGRPFSILGKVRRGAGRGRRLGYPTANLDLENEARPPDGVYAAAVRLDDGRIAGGVLNLGVRPTFSGAGRAPLLEVHLLDETRDLYGRDVEVFFLRRLRGERRFGDAGQLRDRIDADAAAARRILAARGRLRALQIPPDDIHCAPKPNKRGNASQVNKDRMLWTDSRKKT